jgi:hypothetical protein
MVMLSTRIPPPELIEAVSDHRDTAAFGESRRVGIVNVLIPWLVSCGFDPKHAGKILDFGCGCVRLLAGWEACCATSSMASTSIRHWSPGAMRIFLSPL